MGQYIADTDVRIIAISAGHIGLYVTEYPQPFILSALFPFGEEFVTVNRESGQIVDEGEHFYSTAIPKQASAITTLPGPRSLAAGLQRFSKRYEPNTNQHREKEFLKLKTVRRKLKNDHDD